MKIRKCAICDCEAVCVIPATDTPLCDTCGTAYEWGQNDIPDAQIPEDRILEKIDE